MYSWSDLLHDVILAAPPTAAALVAYKRLRTKIGVPNHAEKSRIRLRPDHRRRIEDANLSINTTLSVIHADVLDTRDDINEVRSSLESHIRASDLSRAEVQEQLKDLGAQRAPKEGDSDGE